ncbi:hypothetical protein OKW35_000625 [Paraburkholderia sp. MM5477-R1]
MPLAAPFLLGVPSARTPPAGSAVRPGFTVESGSALKAGKHNLASAKARCLGHYQRDLARTASLISSTLCAESMAAAIRETVLLFEASRGRDDLEPFARALLDRLGKRGKPEAVKVLLDFIERGRLPEAPPTAPSGPISARRPRKRPELALPERQDAEGGLSRRVKISGAMPLDTGASLFALEKQSYRSRHVGVPSDLTRKTILFPNRNSN